MIIAWRYILHRILIVILTSLFLSFPVPVLAGSFKAIPIKLFMDAKSKTAVLKIVNEGEEKVTVQLDTKKWTQDETGKDLYEETADIIVFPKMADIQKGEERIIRVGFKGKPEAREQTYRIFAQELPVSKPGEMALKFALNLSIPLFIKPLKETTEWSVEAAGLSEESLKIKVKNSGNSHIIVSKFKAVGYDQSGKETFSKDMVGWYTLAGETRLYALPIPYEDCLKAKTIKVEATVERVSKEFTLNVGKEMCTRKPEQPKEQKKERGPNQASHGSGIPVNP
jgi:fimbrial chaperone protein